MRTFSSYCKRGLKKNETLLVHHLDVPLFLCFFIPFMGDRSYGSFWEDISRQGIWVKTLSQRYLCFATPDADSMGKKGREGDVHGYKDIGLIIG